MFSILAKIVDRPAQAMALVVERPKSWLLVAILLVVTLLGSLWLAAPYSLQLANERSAEMIERMAATMPEEQAAAVRAAARETTLSQLVLIGGLTGVLVMAGGWLVRAAVIHLSSAAAGGASHWPATFAVTVWSMFPFAVRSILVSIWVVVNKSVMAHEGLSFLVSSGDWVKDSRSLAYMALAQVDPFVLWHLVLLTVGITVATKISRTAAAVMAVVLFAVLLGLKLVPVWVSGMLMGRAGF